MRHVIVSQFEKNHKELIKQLPLKITHYGKEYVFIHKEKDRISDHTLWITGLWGMEGLSIFGRVVKAIKDEPRNTDE